MKLPRDLSGQRVATALRRLGFQVGHQEGSHLRLSPGNDPNAFGPLAKDFAKHLKTGRNNNRRTYARPLVQLNRNTSLDALIFALPLRSEPYVFPAPARCHSLTSRGGVGPSGPEADFRPLTSGF